MKNSMKGIIFSVFDDIKGGKMKYVEPKNIISKEVFDKINYLIIAKDFLHGKIVNINLPELNCYLCGCSVSVYDNNKYTRGTMEFNFSILYTYQEERYKYGIESLVRKMNQYLVDLEKEYLFVKNSLEIWDYDAFEKEHRMTHLFLVLQQFYTQMQNHQFCVVPVNYCEIICLSIKFIEHSLFYLNKYDSHSGQVWEDVEPPLDHYVPVLLVHRKYIVTDENAWLLLCANKSTEEIQERYYNFSNVDLLIKHIVGHLDGYSYVNYIADKAQVDVTLLKMALMQLYYFGLVRYTDIFTFKATYCYTGKFMRACSSYEDQDFLLRQLSTTQAPDWADESDHESEEWSENKRLPITFSFLKWFVKSVHGLVLLDKVLEWQARDDSLELLDQADVRRILTTLMLFGYVEKAQKYVYFDWQINDREVLISKMSRHDIFKDAKDNSKLESLVEHFDGNHSYDEICAKF